MGTGRMAAFSDGVLAIVITIMVLGLKVPEATNLAALQSLVPVLLSYLLSFIYIGIYWNNHHHLLHAVKRVNGPVLWANLHLLFWLTLIPFATAWVGENYSAAVPTALYGVVLLLSALAYYILAHAFITLHGRSSALANSLGSDLKNKLSVAMYVAAILLAFLSPWIAEVLYVAVAAIWFIPDRRIERSLELQNHL